MNLVPSEKPGDIYALVARKAQALVDASEEPQAAAWRGDRVTRAIAKRPCMTYAYSVTRLGMASQIEEALEELDASARAQGRLPHLRGHDNRAAAFWMSRILFDVIGETVPAAKRGMEWLQTAARVFNKADLPIWWSSPTGLPVMQRYARSVGERVIVTFRGQKLQLTLNEERTATGLGAASDDEPLMDARQVLSGIAPNFIHSLDAGHLMAVAVAAKEQGIDALAVIHDSFGTHAAKTDHLASILRETFIAQYETDPLGRFREDLMDQLQHHPALKEHIPPLPPKGALALEGVRDAPYMFA